MSHSALIYDCEIVNCIPPRNRADCDSSLTYAGGWTSYAEMDISTICVYDYSTDAYRVFLEDNLGEFDKLVAEREIIIGFNSKFFDDKLCLVNDLKVETTYDLLSEIRVASGQPPGYVYGQTRKGYSLEALAKANLGIGKSGSGALAPELWQRGKFGTVISYCLNDVAITRKLFELGLSGDLKDPTNGERLELPTPGGWL